MVLLPYFSHHSFYCHVVQVITYTFPGYSNDFQINLCLKSLCILIYHMHLDIQINCSKLLAGHLFLFKLHPNSSSWVLKICIKILQPNFLFFYTMHMHTQLCVCISVCVTPSFSHYHLNLLMLYHPEYTLYASPSTEIPFSFQNPI
jgi:hypothetical protein